MSDASSSMHGTSVPQGAAPAAARRMSEKQRHGPMLPSAPVHTECRSSPLSGDRFMHDAKHSGEHDTEIRL